MKQFIASRRRSSGRIFLTLSAIVLTGLAIMAASHFSPAFGGLAAAAGAESTPDSRTPEDIERANKQVMDQIVALESEKGSRSPAEQKIDSALLQSVRESRGQPMAAGVELEKANVGADTDGTLVVDISADVSDDLLTRIESLGGHIIYPSQAYKTVRAQINLSSVETIAGYPDVTFIQAAIGSMTSRPRNTAPQSLITATDQPAMIFAGRSRSATFAERAARVRAQLTQILQNRAVISGGSVTSQGDRAHRADDTRNTFGYLGAGIRVGVLSDSFNNLGAAPADVTSGDLPGPGNPYGDTTPVTVIQDRPSGGSDEGRAMVQIVHDLAPKAQLFFATADISEAGFASNIQALRNAPNNCDIIVDDVFYFDESPFQDGVIAQAVNTVTAGGALYFSSAGNEGSVVKGTSGYYEGDFNDAGSLAFTFPGGSKAGTIHNFGTVATPVNGDIITATGEEYTLNWSDPAGASSNDYDLFIVSSTGTVKSQSTNIQNGTQNPYEQIAPTTLVAGDRLVVFKTSAAAVRAFAINSLRGLLTVHTTGQTHGHSSASAAFSVAAAPAADAFGTGYPTGPFPNAFSVASQDELFTSDGPRRVFFDASGNALTPGNVLFGTNGGVVRNKPDITAADGVSTTLPLGSGLNPFYGTSAAAPHAGAIAALLKSANPALTSAQIRTILTTTALDNEAAGYDNISGFGIIQAFQAMQAVAPTPQANIAMGTSTVTEGSFSNGNGHLDPGEIGNLVVQLSDPAALAATSTTATITTTSPGVTIISGTANYGSIAAGSSASNTASPFTFAVAPTVACGTSITFTLNVTFGGGPSPQTFLVTAVVGNQPYLSIAGTLGSTPPTLPGMTSTSGQQTGRISRTGVASTCAALKANPGLTTTTGSRQYDAYTFTNTTAQSQCVQVTLASTNGINIYSASYTSAGFVPATPSTNFLADAGSSGGTTTYGFNVAAGATFTVVVHDVNVTPASGSAYTLTVSLANCTAGPTCTSVALTPATISAGSLGHPYSASFSATGGSGAFTFGETGTLPTGLSFSGNGISGTPTQTGSFPITVNATDVGGCTGSSQGYVLSITAIARQTQADFDGDGKSDVSLWRNTDGNWYRLNSSNGAFSAFHFGTAGDVIVPGDYDGDGKTDFAVWRPSTGTWFILGSTSGFTTLQFGLSTDLPVPGDYDGDGKTDIAVYRPSTGVWYMQESTNGFNAFQFGTAGDRPVPADYDGDGKADVAVFRPSTSVWYQQRSMLGFNAVQFGLSTDKVVPADYDGDGKADIAVYRDGNPGVWYVLKSASGFSAFSFGTTGDVPSPGDFDGDGKADYGVFRPSTGAWYVQESTSGFGSVQFGLSGDRSVLSAYVPVQ